MSETERQTLSRDEAMVVRLLRIGFTRHRIARIMGTKEDDIREIIQDLTAHYDCQTKHLPWAARDDMPDDEHLPSWDKRR